MDDLTAAQIKAAATVLQTMAPGPSEHVVIVGGMVPTLLGAVCAGRQAAHLGTADMDLVLDLATVSGLHDATYQGLTETLRRLGLAPDPTPHKQWRWRGYVDGIPVTVELLCDVLDGSEPGRQAILHNAGEKAGDGDLAVMQLPHMELAHLDRQLIRVDAETRFGPRPGTPFPVAGLGSWLILKAAAADNRGTGLEKPGKDVYDVVWLLQCLGPEEVARQLTTSVLMDDTRTAALLRGSLDWFTTHLADPAQADPGAYAAFLEGGNEAVDRLDSVNAIQESFPPSLRQQLANRHS